MGPVLFVFDYLTEYHVQRVRSTAALLAEAGILVHVVVLHGRQPEYTHYNFSEEAFASSMGCAVSVLHNVLAPLPLSWTRLPTARKLLNVVAKVRPRAILSYGYQTLELIALIIMKTAPTILMTDSKLDDGRRSRLKEAFKRSLVSRYDSIFVPGRRHEHYLRGLGYKGTTVFYGLDVVNIEPFAAAAANRDGSVGLGDSLNIICVARLIPKKGVGFLIDAAKILASDSRLPIRLTIVGEGPRRKELEAQTKIFQSNLSVRFLGNVPNQELPGMFCDEDIFVLPSLFDQWGLAANEALAAGLPTIVTATCGCAGELVVDGLTGIVVPPGDAGALAGAIRLISDSPTLSRRLVENGKCRVAEFTPRHFAKTVKEIVQTV